MWSLSLLFFVSILSTMFLFQNTSATMEGLKLPDVRHVNGVALKRNGHGVRSISFFGMDIKVYVAGLYTETPLLSETDVLNNDRMMQMDFTFLRSVGQGRVISAWTQQLDHSVSHKYDGYQHDRKSFIDMLSSPISNGGTQSVQLVGDNTVIVDQGVYKGKISGRNFQRSFLSMWFGERAVAEDLKAGLLHGATHLEPQLVAA
jgi:hypothetical protein